MMERELKVGDIVRIRESAYKPWALEQTQRGDMVVVKVENLPFEDEAKENERLVYVEHADNDCFTGAMNGDVFDYQRETFYESDLVLVEGRRF